MLNNETIRVNNLFNGLGPPVLGLLGLLFGIWLCFVGWDAPVKEGDLGSLVFRGFMFLLGGLVIVAAIFELKRLYATVAIRMELGEEIYVRWLFRGTHYEYRQIVEVRFRDHDGDLGKIPGVLKFSERHIDFKFNDDREADVTVGPQKEQEIIAGLRRKNVPLVFDTEST